LKEANKLNPVIVNRKKEKKKIDDFFNKTADFVKRSKRAKKTKTITLEEDIEESENENESS
jgi:hypothetical protein